MSGKQTQDWNFKAQSLLNSIQSQRLCQDYSEVMIDEEESEILKDLQDAYDECIGLQELESLINEAENLDIYDSNNVYDQLVDIHIESLEIQKQAQKLAKSQTSNSSSNQRQINLIKKTIQNGVLLPEVEQILVQLNLSSKIESAKKGPISFSNLKKISDLTTKYKKYVQEDELLLIQSREQIFSNLTEKIEKVLEKIEKVDDLKDREIKPLISDIKKIQIITPYKSRIEAFISLSDNMRKLFLTIYPHEHNMRSKSLECVIKMIEVKAKDYLSLYEATPTLFLKRLDEHICRNCPDLLDNLTKAIKSCRQLKDIDRIQGLIDDISLIVWKATSIRLIDDPSFPVRSLSELVQKTPKSEIGSKNHVILKTRLEDDKRNKKEAGKDENKFIDIWSLPLLDFIREKEDLKSRIKAIDDDNDMKPESSSGSILTQLIDQIEKGQQKEKSTKVSDLKELLSTSASLGDEIEDSLLYKDIKSLVQQAGKILKLKMHFQEIEKRNQRNQMEQDQSSNNQGQRIIDPVKVVELPRMTMNQARICQQLFSSLILKRLEGVVPFIQEIEKQISRSQTISVRLAEFDTSYTHKQILSGMFPESEGEKVNSKLFLERYTQFTSICKEYSKSLLKNMDLEISIQDKALIFKSILQIHNQIFKKEAPFLNRMIKKDINSWQVSLRKLKQVEGPLYSKLASKIEEKLQTADQFLMEAQKMRKFKKQAEGMTIQELQSMQQRVPTIENLKKIIYDYEHSDSGVELDDTSNFMKNLIDSFERLTNRIPSLCKLSEMEKVQRQLYSLPLKVDSLLLKQLTSRVQKAIALRGLFKREKSKSPKALLKALSEWKEKFRKLHDQTRIIVDEWDSFIMAYQSESELLSSLQQKLAESTTVTQLNEIRNQYKGHSILKTGSAELKIALRKIELIQKEYEKSLFDEVRSYNSELITVEDLDDLCQDIDKIQMQSHNVHYPSRPVIDEESSKLFSFITKMRKDVKRFVNQKVDQARSQRELDFNFKKHPFSGTVDFTSLISLRRETLRKEEEILGHSPIDRKNLSYQIKKILDTNSVYRQVKKGFSTTKVAKQIEKDIYDLCVSRATDYNEFGKSICAILTLLAQYPLSSRKLKDKKFNLRLIEQLFYKSRSELDELEEGFSAKKKKSNAHNLNSSPLNPYKLQQAAKPVRPVYNYYSIFKGTLKFKLGESPSSKDADNSTIRCCANKQCFSGFSQIPRGVTLSTKVKLGEFQRYIDKAILNDNYTILPSWVSFKMSTQKAAKSFFEKNGVVASSQYSKRCKLFIFSKDHIRPEWLKVLNVTVAKGKKEEIVLLAFLVLKQTEESQYEVQMIPQEASVTNTRFFKVFSLKNNVYEQEILVDEMLEQPLKEEGMKLFVSSPRTKNVNHDPFQDFEKEQHHFQTQGQYLNENRYDQNPQQDYYQPPMVIPQNTNHFDRGFGNPSQYNIDPRYPNAGQRGYQTNQYSGNIDQVQNNYEQQSSRQFQSHNYPTQIDYNLLNLLKVNKNSVNASKHQYQNPLNTKPMKRQSQIVKPQHKNNYQHHNPNKNLLGKRQPPQNLQQNQNYPQKSPFYQRRLAQTTNQSPNNQNPLTYNNNMNGNGRQMGRLEAHKIESSHAQNIWNNHQSFQRPLKNKQELDALRNLDIADIIKGTLSKYN